MANNVALRLYFHLVHEHFVVAQVNGLPVKVAFSKQPSNVEPIRTSSLLKFGVVSGDIRSSIVW